MMSKENFDAQIDTISAISVSEVQPPNMPVDTALQEAEDLVIWCTPDKDKLTKAGLDWSLVEDLPARAGACRYAQSVWMREFRSQKEAEQEWKEKSPRGFELRDELLHYFFHAFRNRPDLIRRTQAIAEGGSNADMIQDLSDLHVLGNAHLPLLEGVGMDTSLLGVAETEAADLAEILARANGARGEDAEAKVVRDRAYTHMKQAVDEIRKHGQFVFWRDEARKKGYVSRYHKVVSRKSQSDAAAEPGSEV